jgi:hypothetical protein
VAAATAPVAANAEALLLEGTWEGTWEEFGKAGEYTRWRVTVTGGELRLPALPTIGHVPFRVVPGGRGAVRVELGGAPHPGAYRLDGERILIHFWGPKSPPTLFKPAPGTDLLTLRPAAPRKP